MLPSSVRELLKWLLSRVASGNHKRADIFGASPGLLPQSLVHIVGFFCSGVLELLPARGQRRPDTRPETCNQALPVQTTPNEDQLVYPDLVVPPGVVAGSVADCLMDPLEDKLLVAVTVDAEDALAAENVL